MTRSLSWFALLAALLPRLVAAQPTPAGDDFQVNSYTTSFQEASDAAMDSAGRFVVVWESEGSPGDDTDGLSILGQMYAADGAPLGGEFQVNTDTLGDQDGAQVDMNESGDFVVVWTTNGDPADQQDGARAQRFASDGTAVGGQIQVNSYTTNNQRKPAVAVRSDGSFFVTWEDSAVSGTTIRGRLFGSDGNPLGAELEVTDQTDLHSRSALTPDGGLLVAWNDGASIEARILDSTSAPITDSFVVASSVNGADFDIAVDDSGEFLVVWSLFLVDLEVEAQRFSSDGTAVGSQLQVNTYTTGRQQDVRVAMLGNGDALVSWWTSNTTEPARLGVQAAYLATDGTPVGGQFQVPSHAMDGPGFDPAVATDGRGRFAVSWGSEDSVGDDTDGTSIQARRFSFDLSGRAFLDADLDGIQDVGESGVEEVEVHLYDADDGSWLESTHTDSAGAYVFEGRGEEYFLAFDAPQAYVFTLQDRGGDDTVDSDVDPATGRTIDFATALDGGTWDAGLTNGVGDRVWLDSDGDGVQDGGESGAAGVTVRLFEVGVGEVASDVTDSGGRYGFADLSPSTYYVDVTAPSGFVFSPQNQGDDDTADSDVDPASGESSPFVFTYGYLDRDLDAGLETDGDLDGVADRVDNCPSDANAGQEDADGDGAGDACDVSVLGGRVWLDANLDGLQNGGEAGLENVSVELFTAAGASQGTTLSAADGSFSFVGVPGGTYYLAVQGPAGFCLTAKDQGGDDTVDSDVDPQTGTTELFTLDEGGEDRTRDAGLVPEASVGNRVWLDDGNGIQDGGEPVIEGVTIHLFDSSNALVATTVTDSSGGYAFSPGPGTYYLEFVLPTDMAYAPRDQGSDDEADSDVDAGLGTTSLFTLAPGQVDTSRDAGFVQTVFVDGFESGDLSAWTSGVR